MSNIPPLSTGAALASPGLQGMLLAVLMAIAPLLAEAQISNADAQALLQRHNQTRAAVRSPALCMNAKLMQAAENHCQDMATRNFFSHTGSDGSNSGTRMARTGYSFWTWGENIAWGQRSPTAVMDAWEHSSGHYNNIVNSDFREVGFARCGSNIWVTNFAAPASGRTNCTTTVGGTSPTPAPTPAPAPTTKPVPNQAVYDQCKKFTAGWYYFAASNKYRIWWNNSCYQFDGNTGNMYIMRKTTNNGYQFFLAQ